MRGWLLAALALLLLALAAPEAPAQAPPPGRPPQGVPAWVRPRLACNRGRVPQTCIVKVCGALRTQAEQRACVIGPNYHLAAMSCFADASTTRRLCLEEACKLAKGQQRACFARYAPALLGSR